MTRKVWCSTRAYSSRAAGLMCVRLCIGAGVLLYTDMQFTWGFIKGTPDEKAEMDYQIKRLSHHPSIAMWDGCNECGGGGLYQSFVMPTVAAVDQSRPIWSVNLNHNNLDSRM